MMKRLFLVFDGRRRGAVEKGIIISNFPIVKKKKFKKK